VNTSPCSSRRAGRCSSKDTILDRSLRMDDGRRADGQRSGDLLSFIPSHTSPSSAPKGRRNVARGQERRRRDDPGLRQDKKSKPRGGDGSGPGREPGGPPPAAGLAPLARPDRGASGQAAGTRGRAPVPCDGRDRRALPTPLLASPQPGDVSRPGCGAGRGDRGRRRGGAQAFGARASWSGGHPAPAPAHLSEQVEEITRAAFPRGEQGRPRGLAQGIWPLPCGVPGSGREAQGWRSHGEIPKRLLSAGPAFRPCVSDATAAGGDRRHGATLIRFFRAGRLQKGEVRPSVEEKRQADGRRLPRGRFWELNRPRTRTERSAAQAKARAKGKFLGLPSTLGRNLFLERLFSLGTATARLPLLLETAGSKAPAAFRRARVARPRSVLEATTTSPAPECHRSTDSRGGERASSRAKQRFRSPRARHLDCLPTATAIFPLNQKSEAPTDETRSHGCNRQLPQTELLAGEEAPRALADPSGERQRRPWRERPSYHSHISKELLDDRGTCSEGPLAASTTRKERPRGRHRLSYLESWREDSAQRP
jgi:hypothetical protein